jgi:hypothetical protein
VKIEKVWLVHVGDDTVGSFRNKRAARSLAESAAGSNSDRIGLRAPCHVDGRRAQEYRPDGMMAPKNKCLARSNKSPHRANATKKRNRQTPRFR